MKKSVEQKKEDVIYYYPESHSINIGAKNGTGYWNILRGGERYVMLGQGKTESEAWSAAFNNLNRD